VKYENRYTVTLVDGTEITVDANDKLSAMIRALGKALDMGKSNILGSKGIRGTGIKSCKLA